LFGIDIPVGFYLRDPTGSGLGRRMVAKAAEMICQNGYPSFTLKKLAFELLSVEASIYRYFSCKDQLYMYLAANYWSLVEFRILVYTAGYATPFDKFRNALDILFGLSNDRVPGLMSDIDFVTFHQVARDGYYHAMSVAKKSQDFADTLEFIAAKTNKVRGIIGTIMLECRPEINQPDMIVRALLDHSICPDVGLLSMGLPSGRNGLSRLSAYYYDLIAKP
jgi:AcrR family transcriptional regulator